MKIILICCVIFIIQLSVVSGGPVAHGPIEKRSLETGSPEGKEQSPSVETGVNNKKIEDPVVVEPISISESKINVSSEIVSLNLEEQSPLVEPENKKIENPPLSQPEIENPNQIASRDCDCVQECAEKRKKDLEDDFDDDDDDDDDSRKKNRKNKQKRDKKVDRESVANREGDIEQQCVCDCDYERDQDEDRDHELKNVHDRKKERENDRHRNSEKDRDDSDFPNRHRNSFNKDPFIKSEYLNGKIFLHPWHKSERRGDWYHNEGFCREYGAEMVTIQSSEENEYFNKWMRQVGIKAPGCWLGAQIVEPTRMASTWANGEQARYANIAPGEFNETGVTCLSVGHSNLKAWYNYYCNDDTYYIVCQKRI